MPLGGDVCVVTGACGFLGKRLVKLLLEEEKLAEIRLVDQMIPPDVLSALNGTHALGFFATPPQLFYWSLYSHVLKAEAETRYQHEH